MGLKTTNYVSKKTGHHYATAYAKIRAFVLNKDDSIRVIFGIHNSREELETENIQPMETVEIDSRKVGYKVNRNNAWQEEAYNMAKTEKRVVSKFDEETKTAVQEEVYGTLYGWEDDIV